MATLYSYYQSKHNSGEVISLAPEIITPEYIKSVLDSGCKLYRVNNLPKDGEPLCVFITTVADVIVQ